MLASRPLDPELEKPFLAALELLDKHFLNGKNYITGDTLTIADLSLLASLSFAEACDYDFSKFTNITRWVQELKKLPYYSTVNEEPMKRFSAYMAQKKAAVNA